MQTPQHELLEHFNSNTIFSIREKIHHNLTLILNSKKSEIHNLENYPNLSSSILEFGIPDFTLVDFSNAKAQDFFCHILKQTITKFEPRLSNITVTILVNDQAIERCLKIKIEGMINSNYQQENFELEVKQ